ncbi:hypothetical protein L1049_021664 [Liquidambar formosana]|uniref:rRNA N-glycosylase n=1 Tax=Liquidambar formosana TaxID=63359 RepID=A0AAP0N4S7_LIQFO
MGYFELDLIEDYVQEPGSFNHSRDGMRLGQYQLEYAIAILATSTDLEIRARALLSVIQMICEGSRFDSIELHIASNFLNGSLLHNNMLEQQKNWGHLSLAMLHADANA